MKNPRCSQCENAVPQSIFRCKRYSENIVDGEIGSCDAFRYIEPEPDPRDKLIEQLERDLDKMRTDLDDVSERHAKAAKRVQELERERKFTMYWDISDHGLAVQLKNAETAFDECNSDDPMLQRLRNNLADTIDNFKQALAQRDLARQELKELKEPTPQS